MTTFDDTRTAPAPAVRDVLPPGGLEPRSPGAAPVVLREGVTVTEALAAAAAAGALGRTPLAVASDGACTGVRCAPGDVTGSTTVAGLRAVLRERPEAAGVPLLQVADAPLPVVAAGEAVDAALVAVGEAPAAWVLVDDHLAGWVRRARLVEGTPPAAAGAAS